MMSEDTDMLCPWCGGDLSGKPGQYVKCRHCGSDIHWGDGKPYKTIKDATAAKKKVVPVFEEFKTLKSELEREEDAPTKATLEQGTFEDIPWSGSKMPPVPPKQIHERIKDWFTVRRRKAQLLREKEPGGLKDWWYALYLWQKACFCTLALLLFFFLPTFVVTMETMKLYQLGPFGLPTSFFNRDDYEYGNSKSVVRNMFSGRFSVDEEDYLVGKTLVDGKLYWLAFGFIDDRLMTIQLFANNHLDGPWYGKVPMAVNRDVNWDTSKEYKDIRQKLLRKYGNHAQGDGENGIWCDTPAETVGLSVAEGALVMFYVEKEDPKQVGIDPSKGVRMFWEVSFFGGSEIPPPHLRTNRKNQDADIPENTNEIKSLTAEQAAELVAKVNGNLDLDGLTSIDKDVARELAKFQGILSLDGLTSIDKDIAQELAKFKGERLSFYGLNSIDKEALEILNSYRVDLPGTYEITKKEITKKIDQPEFLTVEQAAKVVSRSKGTYELYIGEPFLIDKEAARELAKFTGGTMYLDGLTSIERGVASELVKFNGGKIDLIGITSINAGVAEELSKFKGSLCLDGITTIDKAIAYELSKLSGTLYLDGLSQIDWDIAVRLSKMRGGVHLKGLSGIDRKSLDVLKNNPMNALPEKYRD